MHLYALAVDYDGTLATTGTVDEETVKALERLRKSGRKLVLVTGRLLEPLLDAFPQVGLFDLVVAENGALLYDPATNEERPLAPAPPREFVLKLAERGVPVGEVGRVIVATSVPHESAVLDLIRDMSLELQIIFNKGAVMVLPSGVNKASGLAAALEGLELSRHNVVGAGDAENDLAFLRSCGVAAAVDNALDSVKKEAHVLLSGVGSAGIVELIDRVLHDDLADVRRSLSGGALVGMTPDGGEVRLPFDGARVLVVGDSASGKSRWAVDVLTQLVEDGFQVCVIDPEGDYQTVDGPLVLGTRDRPPTVEEVMQVVKVPDASCVVSLFGATHEEQPPLAADLYRALQTLRTKTGRPHWVIVDEAHYPVNRAWDLIDGVHWDEAPAVIYVTAAPEQMPDSVLRTLDLVVAMGSAPQKLLAQVGELAGEAPPATAALEGDVAQHALIWPRSDGAPFWVRRPEPRGAHQRHRHQYFDGDMEPPDRFYFRGPHEKLNLAAKNLRTFMDIAAGVDEETWTFHLTRGDYERWFREKIQDDRLARLTGEARRDQAASRERVLDAIRRHYAEAL